MRGSLFALVFATGLVAAGLVLSPVGAAQKPDSDGDGFPDDVDTCVSVFNPDGQNHVALPTMNWDWDGDGIANACDPTPGVPATIIDTHVYFHAKDGSEIANGLGAAVMYHFTDGKDRGPATCSGCVTFGIYRDNSGVIATSADLTVTRLPEGCTNPQPAPLHIPLVYGVYAHYDVTFDGAECGRGYLWGLPDPTTAATTTAKTTTVPTTAPVTTVATTAATTTVTSTTAPVTTTGTNETPAPAPKTSPKSKKKPIPKKKTRTS